jgi:hypothetical protein
MTVESPPQPAPPADAAPVSGEPVHCPLCDYDLRGQTEPRCPECGYQFDWADLTDPARRIHPYLFEHHPRRNTRSFVRTMLGGLRPGKFWRGLKPSQPSRPLRLLLYWLLAALLLPAGLCAAVAYSSVAFAKTHDLHRQQYLAQSNTYMATWGRDTSPGGLPTEIRRMGGVQAYVDARLPRAGTWAYVPYVYRRFYEARVDRAWEGLVLAVGWPWLATLMIFRASMRRANVNAVHVVRCALYCGDACLWFGVLALFVIPPLVDRFDLGRYVGQRDASVTAVLLAAVTAWRLAAAYRHYLQFDRPLATAAAAQAIVLLAVWVWVLQRAMTGGR